MIEGSQDVERELQVYLALRNLGENVEEHTKWLEKLLDRLSSVVRDAGDIAETLPEEDSEKLVPLADSITFQSKRVHTQTQIIKHILDILEI